MCGGAPGTSPRYGRPVHVGRFLAAVLVVSLLGALVQLAVEELFDPPTTVSALMGGVTIGVAVVAALRYGGPG